MLPATSISLLTMNVSTSAAGATMDNIIQNYPGNFSTKKILINNCNFYDIKTITSY